MEQPKLDEVVEQALILMRDSGVSESNLQGYRKLHFRRIQRYFYESGELSFDTNLMDSYQKYQKERLHGGLIGSNYYTISVRAVKILKEVSQTGTLQWRVYGPGPVFKVNSYYQDCVNTFLCTIHKSATTKRHMNSRIRRL